MKIRLFLFLFILGGGLLGFLAWRAYQVMDITIEWTTASELETAGFNIYRGESANGPFEHINPVVIPATGDPLVGAAYSYKDRGVRAGKTYYYNLEEIELDGTTVSLGQIAVVAEHGGLWESLAAALLLCAGALIHCFPKNRRQSLGN